MFGLQFVNDMENMQREINQLFRGSGSGSAYEPQHRPIDFKVVDQGESFSVEGQLPGVDGEKLNISVLGRRLTVSGEFIRPELAEDVRWHRQERCAGTFEKSLHLPVNLDTEKIEAEYRQGILEINLPKAASALPKKIEINVG